jgi:integrase
MSPDPKQVEALTALLEQAGLDASDLLTAITTLAKAKQVAQEKQDDEDKAATTRKNVINKELVYPDEKAIIYQRGDVKTNVYYFRVYDPSSKKQYVKSLETTDRVKALATARNLFQQIKGKIAKNERLVSITTAELIEKHTERLKRTVSNTPHMGITPDSLRLKSYYLRNWQDFIDHLGYSKTTIDRIPKDNVREFGLWMLERPKQSGNINTPRSAEQINNMVGEVLSMYNKTAKRNRLISADAIPDIDRVKESKDLGYKRDILNEDQYTKFWMYMEYTYSKGKKIDANGNKVIDPLAQRDKDELHKRLVFTKTIGILYNTGIRPGEFLKLKWSDITEPKTTTSDDKNKNIKITIRPEVAKTGVRRVIVVPVKKRFDVIKSCYKKMGVDIKPDDFILMNPAKNREAYTRQSLYTRLQRVLKHSGLEEELLQENKRLSLYSSRHFFITMRLRYGKVPLYLLSKVVGTSVKNLTDVYGHIDPEIEADVITRHMGRLVKNGFDMENPVVLTDD